MLFFQCGFLLNLFFFLILLYTSFFTFFKIFLFRLFMLLTFSDVSFQFIFTIDYYTAAAFGAFIFFWHFGFVRAFFTAIRTNSAIFCAAGSRHLQKSR